MKKRALAAVLWFYSFWYAGAMIASVFGLSPALGPILGTAAAAIVAGDPRGIIWNRAGVKQASSASKANGRPVQTPV
jgi:Na+/alanine symporter